MFGVILSLLQSKRIITAPLLPKIIHILISGTWEHQDMSELTMLREGCLPGPCGWALRAHRGEDKVKREAGTRVMLPPNQEHWATPGRWQRQEGASTGVFRGNWVHRHLDTGCLGPRHEREYSFVLLSPQFVIIHYKPLKMNALLLQKMIKESLSFSQ